MDDSELYKKFLEYVREFETQEDAAKALDISPALVTMMLKGDRPISENTARKIGIVKVWQEAK